MSPAEDGTHAWTHSMSPAEDGTHAWTHLFHAACLLCLIRGCKMFELLHEPYLKGVQYKWNLSVKDWDTLRSNYTSRVSAIARSVKKQAFLPHTTQIKHLKFVCCGDHI